MSTLTPSFIISVWLSTSRSTTSQTADQQLHGARCYLSAKVSSRSVLEAADISGFMSQDGTTRPGPPGPEPGFLSYQVHNLGSGPGSDPRGGKVRCLLMCARTADAAASSSVGTNNYYADYTLVANWLC